MVLVDEVLATAMLVVPTVLGWGVSLVLDEGCWLAGGQIPPFWQASIEQQPVYCL